MSTVRVEIHMKVNNGDLNHAMTIHVDSEEAQHPQVISRVLATAAQAVKEKGM